MHTQTIFTPINIQKRQDVAALIFTFILDTVLCFMILWVLAQIASPAIAYITIVPLASAVIIHAVRFYYKNVDRHFTTA